MDTLVVMTAQVPVVTRIPEGKGLDHVRSVRSFSKRHLQGLKRRSGESYFHHGEELAEVLKEVTSDASVLATAQLHDILLHPDGAELLEKSPLTVEERQLVMEMHQLRRLHIDEDTHDLDMVIDAFAHDSRIMILRMAHRLNDIRHRKRFPKKLQKQIARETLHMYTAIAGRLGFHRWRYEMEDACFAVVQPKRAKLLKQEFQRRKTLDELCLSQTATLLKRAFHDAGISALISHRIKGVYSTYRKMVVRHRAFFELTDRLALRIVVPTLDDCYRALGIVHRTMHPMPGKLKDYIGAPKENGYRSIHTVVWPLPGVTEQPIEIQIRTAEMDRECEFGVVSHSEYKRLSYQLKAPRTRVHLWRNLETLRAEARSPEQFERALRSYFDEAHMAVFDQEDRLYHVPKPATAHDFLKLAFPEGWQAVKSVRVNGRKRPMETQLHDGDCVEAIRS